MSADPHVRLIARAVARDAVAHGALAVALAGSHARGDAHAASDIDLMVVLARLPSDNDRRTWLRSVRSRSGHLVSVAWATDRSTRAAFRDPRLAPTFVPGWREAIVLADPAGVAGRLQRAAARWTWDTIAKAADEWVAENITGLAEELHKLCGAVEERRTHLAATQRSILAVQLAFTVALGRRILFGTDNDLWDLVAEDMGPEWASAQSRALTERGESLDASCRAAAELYTLAAMEVMPLLDREQRSVVEGAIRLASDLGRKKPTG